MTHCRKAGSRPKIAYVLTSSASVHFLVGQVEFLVKHGFDVNVISGSGRELEEIGAEGGVPFVLEMEREIAPFQDPFSAESSDKAREHSSRFASCGGIFAQQIQIS